MAENVMQTLQAISMQKLNQLVAEQQAVTAEQTAPIHRLELLGVAQTPPRALVDTRTLGKPRGFKS
eukprot:5167153-Amphidinium_carterae.1